MQHREYFKGLIKKDEHTGTTQSDGKRVSDEVKLLKTLLECQGRFGQKYLDEPLEDGIRWIMGYSNYINQTLLKEKPKHSLRKAYSKGSILYIDFYGHFGNELTYDHPAIVLAESGNDLIVAPITSSPSIYNDSLSYHISLPARDKDFGNMPNPCTIKLEQLRFISKRRILVPFKSRVSDNEKLKEIDIALMKLLAEFTFNTYEQTSIGYEELKILAEESQNKLTEVLEIAEKLDQECIELDQQNEILNTDMEVLKFELEQLRAENQDLKDQIKHLDLEKKDSNVEKNPSKVVD
ncbi:type II toxin-antitoxin system PemK/MazF family toxin (plasmid) [Ureibacillus chungkukjangi]|uniref:type II toxin-antitoxin system PemK/MazF family toxin n=1 Tax=Caryophanaceae TaxID=186818 RepID=UPI000D316D88|nr:MULTISPECIES: type II toxin-antitoxin system PemK/MazF family toxin [Planococcaceae]EFX6585657.1 hypothetical protein [Shigella dysenteriae]HCG4536123.1 type II toxin-antitoxin system PemK/MazF family toxin [Salmonella enterica subsp. enterica serovar Typhi str. AG3]